MTYWALLLTLYNPMTLEQRGPVAVETYSSELGCQVNVRRYWDVKYRGFETDAVECVEVIKWKGEDRWE